MSMTSDSNRPQVLGLVTMTAATSPPSLALSAARSTRPRALAGIGSTRKPQAAAVAGLVPWADSGTSTRTRRSPRASSAARIAIMPHSSPWAPAAGDMATAGMPVSVFSQCASVWISASAPCTVASGCSGCTSAKPGSRAIFSLSRGLCFIVQLPSGNRPLSMP